MKLDEGQKEALRVALLLCIDRSGSMSGNRMLMAKKAAIAAAQSLHEEDRVAVVAFDDALGDVAPAFAIKRVGGPHRPAQPGHLGGEGRRPAAAVQDPRCRIEPAQIEEGAVLRAVSAPWHDAR